MTRAITLEILGDADKATKAFKDVGQAADKMGPQLVDAGQKAGRLESALDKTSGASDASESKFMGMADVLDGLGGAFGLPTEQAGALFQSFGDLTGGFAQIGPLISTVLGKLGLMTTATAAEAAATEGATVAQTGLNVAMLANPIGAIILGIIALVGVFVLLWTKVDGFKEAVIGVFEKIKNFIPALYLLGAAVDFVSGLFGSNKSKAEEMAEATKEATAKMDDAILILNNGVGVNKEAWTQWTTSVQQSLKDILNPLDRAREQSKVSFDDINKNMTDNLLFFEGWKNNLGTIAQRGFQDVALYMQQLGPSAEKAVGEMTTMSDKELQKFRTLMTGTLKVTGEDGRVAMVNAIGAGDFAGLGKNIGTQLGINTSGEYMRIMEEALTALRNKGAVVGVSFGTTVSRSTYVPGRAAGGPVTAGMPYIVGEHQPELFVPNTSGRIVAGGTMSGAGSAVAATTNNSYSIAVTAIDPAAAQEAVITAIKEYERRNGTGWRVA